METLLELRGGSGRRTRCLRHEVPRPNITVDARTRQCTSTPPQCTRVLCRAGVNTAGTASGRGNGDRCEEPCKSPVEHVN